MATALFLGGSGQIGRAGVPALVADGWTVRVLGRSTGRHAEAVRAWGAEPVLGDRADPAALDRALGEGVDVLVDAIGYDDRDAAMVLARADRIGSAVVVSSAAVYADAQGRSLESDDAPELPVPIAETQTTVAPGRGGYAAGKVAYEHAWAGSDVPTTILRPAAIHGPGCRQPREWFFVKRALDGRDVVVLAHDGRSRFHTTSTAVLGDLVRLAAAVPGDRVLNAGDPEALTVAEIAEAVLGLLDHEVRVVAVPGPPQGDLGRTPWSVTHPVVLDVAAARRELGHVAARGYAQSVADAVRWLLAEAGAQPWREAFPGFARMEGGGSLFDYAAEDRWLARLADRS